MINRIHIINGPNLNLLGKREPEIYGSLTFEDYFEELKKKYPDVELKYFQSNHEGAIIDYLHKYGFEENFGFILNAGGLSHTSISLRDAVSSIETPVIEVHISDIHKREAFRQHSYLTDVCVSNFIGLGLKGYDWAIDYFINNSLELP
ncbi:MAG: 3-dehydroquinate dehydratase [Saprospiraceae bacterium]|uniref:3-dehydroquinate dehydratase n=1 Tax=Candidatus Opimibacter skivensis TaxID=2982028 RepID=A0A9D7SZA0_9BACT|nr:3-dehydroquinate dehydratase [Candidatus Opimibacter skivensis]